MPNYWLIKSEPYKYSFAELLRDKSTMWDGVRNYEARNSMRSMTIGDLALFYHSSEGKEVVGIAKVSREAYPDPTAPGEDWSVVDVVPVMQLKQPVALDVIKSDLSLAQMALLKRSRLSVVPVAREEFDYILKLAKTSLRSGKSKKKPSVAKSTAKTSKRPAKAKAPTDAKVESEKSDAAVDKKASRSSKEAANAKTA